MKLQGFVLVLNTFLPAILFVTFCVLFFYYKSDVETGWNETKTSLNNIIAQAEQSVDIVKAARDKAQAKVKQSLDKLNKAKSELEEISRTVKKPIAELGELSLRYPGSLNIDYTEIDLKVAKPKIPVSASVDYRNLDFGNKIADPFRSAFRAIGIAVEPIEDMQEALQELEKSRKPLQEHIADFQARVADVSRQALSFIKPLGQILSILNYVLVALLLWFGLTYVIWARERLSRGWAMLHGK